MAVKYRAEIDGLRAIAVLPVILFHAGFDWFSGGFVGVDVFFVISGYLITTFAISEMTGGEFSIVGFYKRRARRILPALFLVMAFCLPFAWFWLPPSHLKDFGQSLVAVSTFSSNLLFWIESGYFENASEMKPLLHTWSLAVEEQFYFIFPIVFVLIWRWRLKWVLSLLASVFLISLTFAVWGSEKSPSATYFLTHSRIWELLIGVFLALYQTYRGQLRSTTLNQLLGLSGFGMICYSIAWFDYSTPFPSLHTLLPTLGAGLVILCAVPNTILYNVLRVKAHVGIGLISYGAYLWHQPLFAFARHRVIGEVSDQLLVFLCAASLLLAFLSYRLVELPFRNRAVISTRTVTGSLLIATIFFIFIGLLLHQYNGFSSRLVSNELFNQIQKSPYRERCHSAQIPCEFFEGTTRIATFGDSHVVELSYVLAESVRANGLSVQQNSYAPCAPNLSNKEGRCYEWTLKTLERLLSDQRIQEVVVSYSLARIKKEKKEQAWSDLQIILRKLSLGGKKVYFLIQPPLLETHIEKKVLMGDGSLVSLTRGDWNQANDFVFSRLGDVPQEVILLDARDVFCDEYECFAGDEEGYFYFDDNHVSLYGARKIVTHFFSEYLQNGS